MCPHGYPEILGSFPSHCLDEHNDVFDLSAQDVLWPVFCYRVSECGWVYTRLARRYLN